MPPNFDYKVRFLLEPGYEARAKNAATNRLNSSNRKAAYFSSWALVIHRLAAVKKDSSV